MSRRSVLTGVVAAGGVLLGGCVPESREQAETTPPFAPQRTVDPAEPASRVVALSGSDFDTLVALGVEPVAAWDSFGLENRPWREAEIPPAPLHDGFGLPAARSVNQYSPDAIALTGADPSVAELQAFEGVAAVIATRPRPLWREQVQLLARATGTRGFELTEEVVAQIDEWSRGLRRERITSLAIVPRPAGEPEMDVVPLTPSSPIGQEIVGLGFPVIESPEPVSVESLEGNGVRVLGYDPGDEDVMAALAQPSVSSLPWVLRQLTEIDRGR